MGLALSGEKFGGQTLSHEGPEQAMTQDFTGRAGPSNDLRPTKRYTQSTKGNAQGIIQNRSSKHSPTKASMREAPMTHARHSTQVPTAK